MGDRRAGGWWGTPLGIYKTHGLGTTVVGWGAMLMLLYPVCRWYLGVKRRHPHSVLRFV